MTIPTMDAFVAELTAEPWAMEPQALTAFLRRVATCRGPAQLGPQAAGPRRRSTQLEIDGGVGVIPIRGTLMKSVPRWFSWYGLSATAYGDVHAALEEAVSDSRVKQIVLHVESPGGQVAGGQELADAIFAARSSKRVEAVIEDLGASGAYWLASQADHITANPNAIVGSIGVYMVAADFSAMAEQAGVKVHVIRSGEHKGMGVTGAPISDEQIAGMQAVVDGMAENFVSGVARGRGVESSLIKQFATGQVWIASEASSIGLIDATEPTQEALTRLRGPRNQSQQEPSMTTENNDKTEAQVTAAKAEGKQAELDRFRDLKAAFPGESEFVNEQFARGATVAEAQGEFNVILRERLEAAAAKNAELEAAATVAPSVSTSSKPRPAGAEPIAHGTPGANPAEGHDYVSKARAYAEKHACSMREAFSAIAKAEPGTFSAYKSYAQKNRHQIRAHAKAHAKRDEELAV